VLYGACDELDDEVVVEGLEALINELSAIIRYDGVWYSEPTHYVFPHEILDVVNGYGG